MTFCDFIDITVRGRQNFPVFDWPLDGTGTKATVSDPAWDDETSKKGEIYSPVDTELIKKIDQLLDEIKIKADKPITDGSIKGLRLTYCYSICFRILKMFRSL